MSWSNAYIGTPYEVNGRSMDALDCWGLVRQIYSRELGISLPSYRDRYEHSLDGEAFSDVFAEESSSWIPVDDPAHWREFDVLWCRIVGIECHCGVFLGGEKMIHAMAGQDCCIVRTSTPAWARRVRQCYRYSTQ